MKEKQVKQIIQFIRKNQSVSASDFYKTISLGESTIRKYLKELAEANQIIATGIGRATKYIIAPSFELLASVNVEEYYSKDMDNRNAKIGCDFDLISDILQKSVLFSKEEQQSLEELQKRYLKSIDSIGESIYKKRLEVLAIDLIWKSSEIEGNTYSLLETEALIKQHELAKGKTQLEATMLLNHKKAIDFITDDLDYLKPLTINKIIDIH